MRSLWTQICVLYLALAAFAANDPKYDPASNYRPQNVTGLHTLWTWVGSYYNGTLELEFTPLMGRTINETVCENQKYRTIVSKWSSIVTITERGTYDRGPNPVNLFLSYYPPGYNLSSLPYGDRIRTGSTKLHWPITSSEPTWPGSVLLHREAEVHDNLTVTKTNPTSFMLNATLQGYSASGSFDNITMPACNTTTDTDYWRANLITDYWWGWRGWDDLTYPELSVEFDDHSANLTVDGYYHATPYLREEFEEAGGPTLGSSGVLGWVQIRFHGVLDAYHSDVLDVNASRPEWRRTVGFGNNSANVGYESGSPSSVDPWLGGVIASFVAIVMMFV